MPTARDVAPWTAIIEKLWDDPVFEARHRAQALEQSKRWQTERILDQFARLFEELSGSNVGADASRQLR